MKYLIAAIILLGYGCSSVENTHAELPNIIIIYTDDQGYGDLGCYGALDIQTPHIDKLAQEGIRLTNFYVAQPVCTASRVSLLTGCYPNRLGMHGALMPSVGKGIHPDETTLPELLQDKGYSCGIFGKWHLGSEEIFNPLNHGFDEYFGIPYSNDMWPLHPWQGSIFDFPPLPLYDGIAIVDTLDDQSMLTQQLTDRAINFIERHAEGPFFLYLPHPQPHVPLFTSPDFEGRSERGPYGDVIEEIDQSTGTILKKLEELNIASDTWVIFASDNGPWLSYGTHSGLAQPLREGKGTVWEGGVRVPCIMRFPGKFETNSIVTTPVMTIDLLPTIARYIDSPLPNLPIDGMDVWPVLTGQTSENPHDAYFFYYHINELQAVRSGQYKMLLPHSYRSLNERQGRNDGEPIPYDANQVEEVELYDLSQDPGESKDIAKDNPEIIAKMMALAQNMRTELGDRLTGVEGAANRTPGTTNQ